MARWLTAVLALTSALLLPTPGWSQPATAHAPSNAILDGVFIGATAQGRIGDRGGASDFELGLGRTAAAPFSTSQFDWVSNQVCDWVLSYEPESFGGTVAFRVFDADGDECAVNAFQMLTITQFDALYLRTVAALPNTSVLVTGLRLGPPPSAGGGGPIVNEAPGVPAKSHADRNGDGNGSGFDILRLSGVDLLVGFTLQGTVKLVFASASSVPTGDQLSFQVIAGDAPEAPYFPDADGDGVADSVDNCPSNYNPAVGEPAAQPDNDGDELGNPCDNCPDVANPDQADKDTDLAGDACDNCAPGICNPNVRAPLGVCSNKAQSDEDNDGLGFKCDNCPGTPNGPNLGTCLSGDLLLIGSGCTENSACGASGFCSKNQENSNETPAGDACEPSELSLTSGGSAAPAGASLAVIGDGSASASAAGSATYQLYLACGPRNIVEANVGILLPEVTNPSEIFVDFAGCTDPPGADEDPWILKCANSGADLGDTVDPGTSSTIGPEISILQPPFGTSIPSEEFVVLQLRGALSGGLLCEAFNVPDPDDPPDPNLNLNNFVYLGALHLENLPTDSDPTLSDDGLAALELAALVELKEGAPSDVEPENVHTSVDVSGDAEVLASLSVVPNWDDGEDGRIPGRRFAVTLAVTLAVPVTEITKIAFGLRGPADIQTGQMVFGGCTTSATAGADNIEVNSCGDENGPTVPQDLGPYVDEEFFPSFGGTYTVAPNSLTNVTSECLTDGNPYDCCTGEGTGNDVAPCATIPGNTLMVALLGGNGDNFTLNVPPGPVVLGVVDYVNIDPGAGPKPAPTILFQGATALPGVEAPVESVGGSIPTSQVGRVGSGNADLDRDGDARGDNADNCPNFVNPDQLNSGGVLLVGPGDFIGNACTCGDSSGDGIVDNETVVTGDPPPNDVVDCQKYLAMPTTEAKEIAAAQRCSVQSGEEVPTILDLVVLELELDQEASSGAAIEQVCVPATEQ